jgi:hypothetical protein
MDQIIDSKRETAQKSGYTARTWLTYAFDIYICRIFSII